MDIKVSIMNPAGNITALVQTPIAEEDRSRVVEQLMGCPDNEIEQVGFICEPKGSGVIRVEMMGGEFCGNAVRCAGLLWALENKKSGRLIVPVEISSCEDCVAVAVRPSKMEATASMPLPLRHYPAVIDEYKGYICDFGGIVHIVLPGEFPDQDIIDDLLQYGVVNFKTEAVGIIFLSPDSSNLCPVVYVPKVSSLIFEQSCASGTAAACIYQASKAPNGRHHYTWQQPGGILSVDLVKRNDHIEQLLLGGSIGICEKQLCGSENMTAEIITIAELRESNENRDNKDE